MKTFRLFAALLVAALLTPLAFPQESSEIASLLAKARRGNGIAQYNVGLAYIEARGVAADPIEAFVWLSLARDNGARGRALDNLTGSFDRPTLEQAQRRLTERKAELGVRAPGSGNARTETPASTAPAPGTVTPGPAAREIAAAPKSLAPAENSLPVQPQTDNTAAHLQAERDALAARLNMLSAEVAALRAERDRLINLTAEHEKTARAATESSQALQQQLRVAEARTTELSAAADATKGELTRVRMALTAAQKAASPAAPAFPDLRERVADLEAQLATAKSTAPDTAALDQKTRELQAALAELETSRAFGRQVEDTLNKVNDDRARVAATAAAELEAARAFGQQVESTLNRVNDQKTALETALRAAESARDGYAKEFEAAKAQLAAVQTRQPAAPAYPDLRARVTELETNLAAASADATSARLQVTALTQAKAETEKSLAARQSAPAYPDLRSRVAELETALTSASAEATRAQQQVAALTQTRETAIGTLSRELETAKSALAQANNTLRARPAAPTYPDLRNRVTELESQLAGASADLSAVGTAKADLSGRVAELERALAAARSATPAYPDLSGRVAELESAFTAASTGLAQAQTQLAAMSSEAASAKQEMAALLKAKEDKSSPPVAPSYPDLSGKVGELESQLAGLSTELVRARQEAAGAAKARDDANQKAAALELARNEVAKQFDDYKSTTTAAQRERTTLLANVKLLESDKASLRRQAESAGTEAGQLRTQLATLKEQLAAKPALPAFPDLRDRVAQLEREVATARASTPSYPDLSGKVAELETALAAKPAGPSYPDLSGRVAELESAFTAASTNLAQAQAALAARPVLPSFPDLRERVAQLEGELVAARASVPSYPDLSGRVNELETQLAHLSAEAGRARQEVAALVKSREEAKAAPAYPDLSGKVAELESALADSARKLVAADATQTQLQQQLAATLSAAKTKGDTQFSREHDELTGRVAMLNNEVAQLRTDRERMQKMLGDAGRQLRDATADANRIKELETLSAGLQTSLAAANTQTGELQAALAAKPSAPAYPDLSNKVAELEREVAAARNAAPAYPDLTGRVRELEARLANVRTPITAGAPAYPDLSDRVRELEAQLAAAPKSRAPVYPNLAGRVVELESALADTRRQLSESETALRAATQAPTTTAAATPETADTTDLQKRLAETEEKLATALRGYALLEKDHDALQAKSGQANESLMLAKDTLAAQVTTLAAQVEQLQAAAATQAEAVRASAALASDKDALAARLAEVETRAANAQAEATRLGESLAALQRSTGQITGDAASNRALVQQLQGANAVLAQENYQLKTMLARTAGGPAAPLSAPAVRTHVVVSGDSLSRISQLYYGTASRWQEIYNANVGKLGPNGILRVGTELRIP